VDQLDQPSLKARASGPVPVVMSLDPPWYELMWTGQKTYEFRRRFLTGSPAQWFVYLTAPENRLCAVIDLDVAIEDTPERIAQIAERMHAGSGATVQPYLARKGRSVGYAMPIQRVRQYTGFAAAELERMLNEVCPPQGYIRLDQHPGWRSVCDKLLATPMERETTISPAP
jgi:predicted transcriptional regulator